MEAAVEQNYQENTGAQRSLLESTSMAPYRAGAIALAPHQAVSPCNRFAGKQAVASIRASVLAMMVAVASPLAQAEPPQYRPVDVEILQHLKRSPVELLLHVPQPEMRGEARPWSWDDPHNLIAETVKELTHQNEERVMLKPLREALTGFNVDTLLLRALEAELNGSAAPRVGTAKLSKGSTFRAMEREEQAGERVGELYVLLGQISYYLGKNKRVFVIEAKVGLWPRQSELVSLRDTRYPEAATRGSVFDRLRALYENQFRVAIALADPGADDVAVALWSEDGAARAKAVIAEASIILAKLVAKDVGEVGNAARSARDPREQMDFQVAGKRVQVDRLDTGAIWAFATR